MDESTRPAKPNRLLGYSIHLLILLVGVASGVALIYSLQPPPAPPYALLYEVHLFTSNKPIPDFSSQIIAFRQAADKGVFWDDPGSAGSFQYGTSPGRTIQFSADLQTQLFPHDAFTAFQFEFRGDPDGDRIRASLAVETAGSAVAHRLDLGEGEYRIIEILPGESSGRRWCYVILFVEAVKPSSTMAAPLPMPPPSPSRQTQ